MKQHLEGLSLFLPLLYGLHLGNASHTNVSYHFHLHCVFQFFNSIQVAGESCNFSNFLPGGTSQFYPCAHHESIFRIHNFCSECMHSELANLACESITFLTILYFSVEKNSNSAVGHSNQHHPFDHSSNKLFLVFQLNSQRNQFFQFRPSQLHELLSA